MEKRLQSIKIPRDLTLGGTKQKKIFIPNLNVARNKGKKEQFTKNEEKKKNNNPRKNVKKYERPERFIQSSGIFSEGVGSDVIKRVRSERTYSTREDTGTYIPIPKVKKDDWQVDDRSENKVYEDIIGCDDFNDSDEKLPFAPLEWSEADLRESKVPFSVKQEIKVTHDEPNININKLKIGTSRIPREFKEADRFSDSNPALMLWTMPDSFGKGLSDDPNIKTLFDYKLHEMLEGQIGKISIRRSGKVEVSIGCVKYNLEQSNLQTFGEKIVKLEVSQENKAEAAVLGNIHSRFILNPDWQYLLNDL